MAQVGWNSTQKYYTYVWVDPPLGHVGPEPLVQQVVFKGRNVTVFHSLHILNFSFIGHIFLVCCSISCGIEPEEPEERDWALTLKPYCDINMVGNYVNKYSIRQETKGKKDHQVCGSCGPGVINVTSAVDVTLCCYFSKGWITWVLQIYSSRYSGILNQGVLWCVRCLKNLVCFSAPLSWQLIICGIHRVRISWILQGIFSY